MPIYNFACTNDTCENKDVVVDKLVRSYDTKPPCEKCKSEMTKQFSSTGVGVKLKGSGWFKTGGY